MPEGNSRVSETSGPNINDWAEAVRPIDEAFADRIGIPRQEGYRAGAEIGLPMPDSRTLSLPDFLMSPNEHLQQFDSECYIVALLPHDANLPRVSTARLDSNDIISLVHDKVPEAVRDSYDIRLMPYYDVKYGGNIVANPNGTMHVEFRQGLPGPVAYGTETPPFSASRDQFLHSFKYSFEDEDLRKQISEVIAHIPHSGEARETQYHPGYYEFIVVDKGDKAPLKTLFIDYRHDPSYSTDSGPKAV
jgi:hypothetical protein